MDAQKPGRLIVIDGADGTGKQTQSRMLVNALQLRGEKALYTEEPTTDGIGLQIKKDLDKSGEHLDPRTLQYLFTADRSNHVQRVIAPALRDGIHVVADRYYPSTMAYAMALRLPENEVEALVQANLGFPKPDKVIIIDLAPATALERMNSRGRPADRHEKDLELQERVRLAYHRLTERFGRADWEWCIVSGALSAEEVHKQIIGVVDGRKAATP